MERYKIKHIFLSLLSCYYLDKCKREIEIASSEREFAYSQMVIKPSFLSSGGEGGDRNKEAATDSELAERYRKQVFPAKKRRFLISFHQLAAQLMWNKKSINMEITMCLNLVC